MGSEIDVVKLRSSLELFLKVTPNEDAAMLGQAQDILNALG
jgi:hypothetical protein